MAGAARRERAGRRWAPAVVEAAVRSRGEALPADVIAAEQPGFAVDLRRIEIHTGALAEASTAAIGADAFAVGRHVVVRPGLWAPRTAEGRALLRHELTHAVEQAAAEPSAGVRIDMSPETGVEAAAEAAERGTTARPHRTGLRVAARASRAARATGTAVVSGDATRVAATGEATVTAPVPAEKKPDPARDGRVAAEVYAAVVRRRDASPYSSVEELLRRAEGAGAKAALRAMRPPIRSRLRHPGFGGVNEHALLYTDDLGEAFVRLGDVLLEQRWWAGAADVLEGLTLAERREAEARVDQVFYGGGEQVGANRGQMVRTLRFGGGLVRSLPPSSKSRLLTQLERDLRPSDRLFFALSDGDDNLVLALLRRELLRGGLAGLKELGATWDREIRGPLRSSRADLLDALPHSDRELFPLVRERLSRDGYREYRTLVLEAQRREAAEVEEGLLAERTEAEARDPSLRARRLAELSARLERRLPGSGREAAKIVLEVLGREKDVDVAEVQRVYERRAGRSVRAEIRREGLYRTPETIDALALLTTGRSSDPYAQLGLALLVTQDALAAHATLYGVKTDEQRALLHRYYGEAFTGWATNEGQYPAYRHARVFLYDANALWRAEKTELLLDHLPAPAEELYFVTWCPGGLDQAKAVELLEKQWSEGQAKFAELVMDWQRSVVTRRREDGSLWCPVWLVPAMQRKLTANELVRAQAIFDAFERTRAAEGQGRPEVEAKFAEERARIAAARRVLENELSRQLFFKKSVVFAQFAALGKVFAERRKRRLAGEQADEARRDETAAFLLVDGFGFRLTYQVYDPYKLNERDRERAHLLLSRGGALRGSDEVALARSDGFGETNNIDFMRLLLAKVTTAWVKDEARTLAAELEAPVDDELVPFVQLRSGVKIDEPSRAARAVHRLYRIIVAMLDARRDRLEVGAYRLHEELDIGGSNHDNDDVRAALAFLTEVSEAERPGIVNTYVARYVRAFADSPPNEQFVLSLRSRFELTPALTDLSALVLGEKRTEDGVLNLELRDLALHSGYAGGLLDAVTRAVQGSRPDDPERYVRRALGQLRRLARDERIQPETLAGARLQAGAASDAELAKNLIRVTRAYQDEALKLRLEIADVITSVIQVAGRSLLVGLTGPVGLAGLAAALLAIPAAYVAREALLGANNDALAAESLKNLASEISGALFEVSGFENVIEALVKKKISSQFGQIVATELLKTAASETIDGTVERAITGNGLPNFAAFEGKVLSTLTQALLKAGTKSSVADRITYVESVKHLWGFQTAKILINGPPPAAALPRQLIGAMFKFGAPGAPEFSPDNVLTALKAAALTSALTSVSVATAFTAAKLREFRAADDAVSKNRAGFFDKLTGDSKLIKAYEGAPGDKPPIAEWALATAIDRTNPLQREVAKLVTKAATGFDEDRYGIKALVRAIRPPGPGGQVLVRRRDDDAR